LKDELDIAFTPWINQVSWGGLTHERSVVCIMQVRMHGDPQGCKSADYRDETLSLGRQGRLHRGDDINSDS
jgi:hypothetical protein